jgi:hypothetical protein
VPPDWRKDDNQPAAGAAEVYFEFQPIGNAVRVAAVDAATGVEVTIMGPLTASRADLQRLALRKLRMQQAKGD